MPMLRRIETVQPGMTIADPRYDGNRVMISVHKTRVHMVTLNACTRRKIHVNDTTCYDEGAQVWVM